MKHAILGLAVIGLALPSAAQDITLKINPGMWENAANISVELDMGGQTMTIPVSVDTDQECVTDEEATLDLSDFAEDGCSVDNVVQSGQTVSADLSCDADGVMMMGNMTTTVSADGNSAETEISATGTNPMGGAMNLSGTVSGKRVGGC